MLCELLCIIDITSQNGTFHQFGLLPHPLLTPRTIQVIQRLAS